MASQSLNSDQLKALEELTNEMEVIVRSGKYDLRPSAATAPGHFNETRLANVASGRIGGGMRGGSVCNPWVRLFINGCITIGIAGTGFKVLNFFAVAYGLDAGIVKLGQILYSNAGSLVSGAGSVVGHTASAASSAVGVAASASDAAFRATSAMAPSAALIGLPLFSGFIIGRKSAGISAAEDYASILATLNVQYDEITESGRRVTRSMSEKAEQIKAQIADIKSKIASSASAASASATSAASSVDDMTSKICAFMDLIVAKAASARKSVSDFIDDPIGMKALTDEAMRGLKFGGKRKSRKHHKKSRKHHKKSHKGKKHHKKSHKGKKHHKKSMKKSHKGKKHHKKSRKSRN